jgi:hypothetical protein
MALSPQSATDCTNQTPVFKSPHAYHQTSQSGAFGVCPTDRRAPVGSLRQWGRRVSGFRRSRARIDYPLIYYSCPYDSRAHYPGAYDPGAYDPGACPRRHAC